MQKREFNKGDIIIRQGEPGESFFQIEKGSVEAFITQDGQDLSLSALKAGDYFGEMAVLEVYPRSASIRALEDGTEVMEIPAGEINDYFTQEPEKILALFRHIGGRLRDLTKKYTEASAVKKEMAVETEKSEGLLSRIRKVVSGFFKGSADSISAETESAVSGADFTAGYSGEVLKLNHDTVIFREGEPGRCIYAIHWGKVGIYAAYGTPEQKLLAELMPGQFFGEMGMIENTVRSATAVAMEDDTAVEVITSDGLKDLFAKNPLKVDMILQNLSYRLRRLTNEYAELQAEISENQG